MSEPGSLTSDQTTEVTGPAYRRADFLYVDFPSGRQAWTTLGREITTGGTTYKKGILRGIDGLRSSEDRDPKRVTIELPGVDAALRDAITNDDYHFAEIAAHLAVVDEDLQLIGDLIRMGSALLSSAELRISEGSALIELTAESPTVLLLRRRRVISQDSDQRWRYGGDLFFDQRPYVADAETEWGGNVQGGTTPVGGRADDASRSPRERPALRRR